MIGTTEIIIILIIILILFGPQKLPELARAIGKSINEYKKGLENVFKECFERYFETFQLEHIVCLDTKAAEEAAAQKCSAAQDFERCFS